MQQELVTRAEIARRLGISRERARQLALHREFPPPAGHIGRLVAWRDDDIAAWAQRRGRRYRGAAGAPPASVLSRAAR